MARPKYKGTPLPVALEGEPDLIVPTLLLAEIDEFLDVVGGDWRKLITDKTLRDRAVEMIHTAVARNYPELTLDDFRARVDLASFRNALPIVLGAAGLVARQDPAPTPAASP